jgi:hypothetical protein
MRLKRALNRSMRAHPHVRRAQLRTAHDRLGLDIHQIAWQMNAPVSGPMGWCTSGRASTIVVARYSVVRRWSKRLPPHCYLQQIIADPVYAVGVIIAARSHSSLDSLFWFWWTILTSERMAGGVKETSGREGAGIKIL